MVNLASGLMVPGQTLAQAPRTVYLGKNLSVGTK